MMDDESPLDTYKWVHSSAYSSLPPDAIVAGNDTDGAQIYVGRAFHNGDTLVAKVLPSKHIAFVTWRGEEIPKEHFEILCGKNLCWRHCYDHIIPENAVVGGETSLGQAIYIGRGHYNRSLTVGKISSVHRALFIAYGGTEKRLESYEILVHEKGPTPGWAIPTPLPIDEKYPLIQLEDTKQWITTAPTPPSPTPPPPPPPPYTAHSSSMSDPPPPYAPFTYTPPQLQPQETMVKPSYVTGFEAIPEKKYNYMAEYKPSFQMPSPYPPTAPSMITPAETYIPMAMAVPPAPSPYTPAEVYIPSIGGSTTMCSSFDVWVPASDSYIPPNAFRAGQDTDLSSLYVCRAFHNGHLLPGKANPSQRCAYVSCDGQEIRKYNNFEILVGGDRYHWVPTYNGNVPPGSVEGGRTLSGEVLFVGRSFYNGSQTPGKVHPSHGCLYIPYGGQEVRLPSYDVLVRW